MKLIAVVALIAAWTGLGYILCAANGYISGKQLKKYYRSEDDMRVDLIAKNYTATGESVPSDREILLDSIFWPRTLYYAMKGKKKIIEELRNKE